MFVARTTMLIRDCQGTPHNPGSSVVLLGEIKQAEFSTERIRVKFTDNGQIAFVSPTELKFSAE